MRLPHRTSSGSARPATPRPASPDTYDGMELSTPSWVTEPVTVLSAHSSLFDADPRFAGGGGAAELDCGLLMRQIPVRWNTVPQPDAHAGAQT